MTTPGPPFHHEALLYEGREDLARRLVPFIREGVRAGEPVMAALTADKLDLLRDELGPDGEAVRFADMEEIGRNPATIIPAWRAWLDEHDAGRPLRGIGFTWEADVHWLFKRAQVDALLLGGAGQHRRRLAHLAARRLQGAGR